MSLVPVGVRVARCRMLLAGLVVAAGLCPGLPVRAQEPSPRANVAETAQGGGLPASIPVRREQSGDGAGAANDLGWIAILVALGLVAAAVFVARRRVRPASMPAVAAGPWWSRLGGLLETGPSREIERVSSMALSPRHSLHVVVWDGRRLLIGCTDHSIQLLTEARASSDSAASQASAKEMP